MTGKRKWFTIFVVAVMVFGLMSGLALAEEECPAAPDVAGQILEEFDVDFRYEAGVVDHPRHGERIVYANYISMVAQTMINEAAFPAYEWNGEWDGETYIDKCDVEAYYQAVYNYLVALGADIPKGFTVELLHEIADGFVCQTIMAVDDNYPTVRVTDVHGNPVQGIELRASIPRVIDLPGSRYTDDDGIAIFDHLSYNKPGTWRLNFWVRDPDLRYDRALSNEFQLIHNMIGTWEREVERLYVIDWQENGNFSGKSTLLDGTIVGNVTGTVDGDSISMLYDRVGYAVGGYFVDFEGTMIDCNSASGTYVHGDDNGLRDGIFNWSMERQQ